MREFDHDIDLLKQDQLKVVNEGKAEKEKLLSVEIDKMDAFLNGEVKSAYELNVGNSILEEQFKCVDKVLDDRKEKLTKLLENVVQTENDEVTRESGMMVSVRVEHESNMQQKWKEYSEEYGSWREVIDRENGKLLEKNNSDLKGEIEVRMGKEMNAREDWIKFEKSASGMFGGVESGEKEFVEFGGGLVAEQRAKGAEINKRLDGDGLVVLVHNLRENVLNAITLRKERKAKEAAEAEERRQREAEERRMQEAGGDTSG